MPEWARVHFLWYLGSLMAAALAAWARSGFGWNPGRGPGAERSEDAGAADRRAGGDATGLGAAADDLVGGAGGVLLDIACGRSGHEKVAEVAGGLVGDVVDGHVVAQGRDIQQRVAVAGDIPGLGDDRGRVSTGDAEDVGRASGRVGDDCGGVGGGLAHQLATDDCGGDLVTSWSSVVMGQRTWQFGSPSFVWA